MTAAGVPATDDSGRDGRCGEGGPVLADVAPAYCSLRAGHDGWHVDGPTSWSPTPARPGTAELREEIARALFEHAWPNLYYETAGVKTHIEFAQRADAVLALPRVQRLLADAECWRALNRPNEYTADDSDLALGGGDDA